MPKRYIDLNRTRKVYPMVRARPRFVTMKENINDIETARIEFANTTKKVYTFNSVYTKVPVVILTPENENVNAYITAIDLNSVTIQISGVPDSELECDVYIHLQAISQD